MAANKKRKNLELVVDNGPIDIEKLTKNIGSAQLGYMRYQKHRIVGLEENIRSLNEEMAVYQRKVRIAKVIACSTIALATIATLGMLYRGWGREPIGLELTTDLNYDGVSDAYIIQNNGHKVPLYGLKNGDDGSISYKDAEYIKKFFSHMKDESAVDYQSIEDKINKRNQLNQ